LLSPQELVSLLRNQGSAYRSKIGPSPNLSKDNKLAVVDVRDDDYEGGHIKGCIRAPSVKLLDGGIEQLREQVKDTPTLVFHCALSQVR
jgi:rhodanese-related sulfurtransferase